jgi:predicted DNA-binding protein (MmcQ/YjbR family)
MAELENRVIPLPEDILKRYQWLDECLQKQPATEREFQPAWQAYKYLLRGKMYAFIGMNDQNGRPVVTLKLEPAHSELLRSEYGDVVPGYYMNKLHWSTVYLDGGVPKESIEGMARASYAVMLSSLSRKARREIKGE